MNKIEKLLNEEKLQINQMNSPNDLEAILRSKLDNHQKKHIKKYRWVINVAIILILVSAISFNFDILAYYSKKLIGYDQVMNGTLKNLNELGKGQLIDETYTFDNGVIYTLDGIMLDDNQLLVFYTINDPSGKVDELYGNHLYIQGKHHQLLMNSSTGIVNEDNTEMKNVASYETPYFFEKKFTFKISLLEEGVQSTGEIKFTLDRNKAMGHTLKEKINQSVEVGNEKITFESIQASPTSTVIEGNVQDIFDIVIDKFKGERIGMVGMDLELELIADDQNITRQGAGISTNLKGTTFSYEFDALPTELEKLQIKFVSFGTDHVADEQFKLNKDIIDQTFEVMNQNIVINEVYENNGDTYVTFTTEESTVLTSVYLSLDGTNSELVETIEVDLIKTKNGNILHTRTMHFTGTGNEIELDIQRIHYSESYDKIIDIPLD